MTTSMVNQGVVAGFDDKAADYGNNLLNSGGHAVTFDITEDQYNAVMEYCLSGARDKRRTPGPAIPRTVIEKEKSDRIAGGYTGIINSCVDFAFSVLEVAGSYTDPYDEINAQGDVGPPSTEA